MYKIWKVLYSKDYDLKSFEDETEKNKHNLMRTWYLDISFWDGQMCISLKRTNLFYVSVFNDDRTSKITWISQVFIQKKI